MSPSSIETSFERRMGVSSSAVKGLPLESMPCVRVHEQNDRAVSSCQASLCLLNVAVCNKLPPRYKNACKRQPCANILACHA